MTEPFFHTLRELRSGRSLDELAEALQLVVEAVRKHGKPGRITIQLDIRGASRGDRETILIHDTIKVKAPEGERAATLFFATPENNLTRTNQRQGELLHGVDDDKVDKVIKRGEV